MSTPSDTPESAEIGEIFMSAGSGDLFEGPPMPMRYVLRDMAGNVVAEGVLKEEVNIKHAPDFTWEHHDAIDEAVMTWRAEAGSFDDPATPSVNEHERANYALMLEALEKLAALLPPKEEAP